MSAELFTASTCPSTIPARVQAGLRYLASSARGAVGRALPVLSRGAFVSRLVVTDCQSACAVCGVPMIDRRAPVCPSPMIEIDVATWLRWRRADRDPPRRERRARSSTRREAARQRSAARGGYREWLRWRGGYREWLQCSRACRAALRLRCARVTTATPRAICNHLSGGSGYKSGAHNADSKRTRAKRNHCNHCNHLVLPPRKRTS